MSSTNYNNLLIKKPWGEEYQLLLGGDVALWHLTIKIDEETSLHCHPNKKTSLIVIKGMCDVSFLGGNTNRLKTGDKITIRHGVFHSTKALNNYNPITGRQAVNLELIEVETPNNKEDLIRLKDRYGRAGQSYEKGYEIRQNPILTYDWQNLGDCQIKLFHVKENKWSYLYEEESNLIGIIIGGIRYNDYYVASNGDVLTKKNMLKLADEFTTTDTIGFLVK